MPDFSFISQGFFYPWWGDLLEGTISLVFDGDPSNIEWKDDLMILINKAEKDAIHERFPNVFIIRTMKHDSKRHHYYCEEDRRVVRYLNERRGLVDYNANK